MEKPAEIGEKVLYTGELQHAGPYTQLLIRKWLIPGNWYEVLNIDNHNKCYRIKFKLEQLLPYYSSLLFPIKCFNRNYRKYMTDKYNLI